jgi:hypothetical protein
MDFEIIGPMRNVETIAIGRETGSYRGCVGGTEKGAGGSARASRGFASRTAPSIWRKFIGMKLTVSAGGR